MKKKIIMLSMIAALGMPLMSNAADHDAPPPPPPPPAHQPGDHDHPPMEPAFRFSPFQGIKLTAEQRHKIDQIRQDSFKPEKRDVFKDGLNAEERVRAIVTSEDYSKEKVAAIVQQVTDGIVQDSVRRADEEHKIFEVLTPEQKVQYKKNISIFEKQMNDRRGPMQGPRLGPDGKPLPPPAPQDAPQDHK